jgi:hypothetical protein
MARVFLSLRFGEAMAEARLLKAELQARGVSTFLCEVPEGGDIMKEIQANIMACELAVVLGSATYGMKE